MHWLGSSYSGRLNPLPWYGFAALTAGPAETPTRSSSPPTEVVRGARGRRAWGAPITGAASGAPERENAFGEATTCKEQASRG